MDTLKTILASRLTQLGARYLGVFLIAKLGYDQSHADDTVRMVAELAVAGIMFGVDHVLHAVQKKAGK